VSSTITPPSVSATSSGAQTAGPQAAVKAKAKGGGGRNRVIDGYRGIAAIGVIFGHATLINSLIFSANGREANDTMFDVLPFFFVLSGLLTYRAWVIGALSGRIPRRGETISSRLWRILPVYYVIVLLVWSMHFVDSTHDWIDLVLHLSFMQVWSPHYVFWLDGPAWFLSDDMQFFFLAALLAPFLCQLALRIPLGRGGLVLRMSVMATLPLAMLAAGCFDIWWNAFHRHNNATWVHYTPLYTVPEFAVGMLLAVVLFSPGVIKIRPRFAASLTILGFLALGAIAYYSWRADWLNLNAFGFPIVAVACCLLITGAFMTAPDSRFARIMGIAPLQLLATVGLTILLVQEPLMNILTKWGFVSVWTPLDCWISATFLLAAATGVAWAATLGIERPALKYRQRMARLGELHAGRDRHHRGPIPRMLPDIPLTLPSGEQISVRSVVGDRPLLLSFGDAGTGALAEQRFRLDSGESVALHVTPSLDRSSTASARLGATVAFDPDGKLSRALNIPVALVEVGPDGLITSFQRSRREALGAWT
jgi:peptidoglycan/LPS O-acetylase OafA/YrhL